MTTERLRELAERATAGEWQLQDGCSWRRIGTRDGDGNVLCPYITRTDRHPDLCAARGEDVYDNLNYIIAAQPRAILSLLDELDALRKAVKPFAEAFDEGNKVPKPSDGTRAEIMHSWVGTFHFEQARAALKGSDHDN